MRLTGHKHQFFFQLSKFWESWWSGTTQNTLVSNIRKTHIPRVDLPNGTTITKRIGLGRIWGTDAAPDHPISKRSMRLHENSGTKAGVVLLSPFRQIKLSRNMRLVLASYHSHYTFCQIQFESKKSAGLESRGFQTGSLLLFQKQRHVR